MTSVCVYELLLTLFNLVNLLELLYVIKHIIMFILIFFDLRPVWIIVTLFPQFLHNHWLNIFPL